MKKIYILAAALTTLMLFSCQKEKNPVLEAVVLVKQIELNYGPEVASKVYIDANGDAVYPMKIGESQTLSCNFTPSAEELTSKKIRWSSSNPKVASVDDNGVVKALAAGDAGITVQQYPFSNTASASLKVSVFETAVPATGITITVPVERETTDDGTPIVYEGEDVTLGAVIAPEDATYRTVVWSVAPAENARINALTGVVTGVKSGIVTVTATGVVDTGVKATLRMAVTESIDPQGVRLTAPAGPLSVSDGTYKIAFETYPAVSTKSRIRWTSSDEEVATVEKGIVTILRPGEVDITATCPDGTGGDGFEASSSVKLNIPAGYYREHLENPSLWIAKTNGTVMTLKTSEAGEQYYDIVPNLANSNTGRGDFGHAGFTYVSRAYPIITFRLDDVNDIEDETGGKFSRNINLDTSGTVEDGTKFSGNVGGNNNKWSRKIKCSDGSAILVYDLSAQSFGNGGLFPENTVGTFSTWQIKYADIRNADKSAIQDIAHLRYRFFWHHTFTSNDEMTAYLNEWSAATGITYEGGPGWMEPTVPETPAGLKLALASDVASVTDGTYQIAYTTSPETGDDVPSITWTSSNPDVATVADGGVVTIVGTGSVSITATCVGDKAAPDGFVRSATFSLEIPVGFYQEHMAHPELWAKGQNGTVISPLSSTAGENYLSIVPENQTSKGRGDVKHVGPISLNRAYPILTFRLDDVNDMADETGTEGKKSSRNINVDAAGKGSDDLEYKGNLGGNNNKWSRKIKCTDGSVILVYDLSEKAFPTGGVLPEDVTAAFTTFQIKYADIKNSDGSNIQDISHLTYRFFWFHTFKSNDELNAYLAQWSSKTGISYE